MEKEFNEFKARNPGWSTYTCFMHTVRGKNLPDDEIVSLFYQYVERGDYSKTGISEVLQHCMAETKSA